MLVSSALWKNAGDRTIEWSFQQLYEVPMHDKQGKYLEQSPAPDENVFSISNDFNAAFGEVK